MANYKRIFMDGYSYFITVITHQRNPILIDNITLLRESFKASKMMYKYSIDAIVIMPDHFHMIITPEYAEEYPHIIRTIKQHFSKHCPRACYSHLQQSGSRDKKGYKPIWQKRYYEHTIRNDEDMAEKRLYMFNNPVKHGYVESVEDWGFSSFGHFKGGRSHPTRNKDKNDETRRVDSSTAKRKFNQ